MLSIYIMVYNTFAPLRSIFVLLISLAVVFIIQLERAEAALQTFFREENEYSFFLLSSRQTKTLWMSERKCAVRLVIILPGCL